MKWVRILGMVMLFLALLLGSASCADGDKTPPSRPANLTRTTPANVNTPAFSWEGATDGDSGVARYLAAVDDGQWSDVGSVTSYACSTPLSDGMHDFKVRAVDGAGNQGTAASLAFTVDAGSPFEYGAGANPTGNPIGGGAGYSHYYSPAGATTVTTQDALTRALHSARSGDVIWIPGDTTITISGEYGQTVESGVILASNRGQNGSEGGRLLWTYTGGSSMTALLTLESNCKVSGLRLEGPIGTAGLSGRNGGSNIGLRGVDGSYGIEIENCEISKFAWAGIYFNDGLLTDSNRHYVHHCYIHNCQRHGYGYGISEEGSAAYLAECNVFRENRHHIMAQAGMTNPNSYEVRYNEFYEAIYASEGDVDGTWYYSHQVDCHGGSDSPGYYAGDSLRIHHNTFYDNGDKPNVCIRGVPKTLCEVSWNWTVKDGTDAGQDPGSSQWSQLVDSISYKHMTVHDNWYGTAGPTDT